MRLLCLLVGAALGLVGCGGGSDDDSDATKNSIAGTWAVELSNGCGFGFTTDEKTYEADLICPLQTNTYGIDAEVGSCAISGSQLTLTPMQVSCPTTDHPVETIAFTVQGDTLKLVLPSGVIILQRVSGASTGGAVASFGCVDLQTGQFTQHDIGPL